MEGIQAKTLVTWALLAGILWELSKMAPTGPVSAFGASVDGACCTGCAPQPLKQLQQSSQTPFWMTQMRDGASGQMYVSGVF